MSNFTGLTPNSGQKKRSGYIREEFQNVFGAMVPDCILGPNGNYGGKITPGTGLQANISPFEGVIGGKFHRLTDMHQLNLSPRKASIIYETKNPNNDNITPIIGKYDAVYPEPDNNTIAQWRFNQTGNIPNYAVGKSSIAVANDLVPSGTLTRVDGWCDYAMKSDGSTGVYTNSNATGFPTGPQTWVLKFRYIKGTGTYSSIFIGLSQGVTYLTGLYVNNGTGALSFYYSGTSCDSGFSLENNKEYLAAITFDGSLKKLYMNGVLVFSLADTTPINAQTIYLNKTYDGTFVGANVYDFLTYYNKVLTPAQIATISNKLCFPVRYNSWLSSYPTNPTDVGYHCWKFDDASGSTVTDEAGTMNGTATGTTIVYSEIGLGKARRFNGSSDLIGVGNYSLPSDFTVMGVINNDSMSNTQSILGNYNGANGNLLTTSYNGNGKINLWSPTNGYVTGNSVFPRNKLAFLGWSQKNGMATLYCDSLYPDAIIPFVPYTASATNLQVGQTGITSTSCYFGGSIEYLVIIPRALSQSEISQYYNTLMKQGERTIVNDCLSANSISLGFVRTNFTRVIEIDDNSNKYMRNEGATKVEGNKRVFLGFKYFNGFTVLKWDNPFGTRKIRTYYVWAQDANGTNESDITYWFADGAYYGVNPGFDTSSDRIKLSVLANGACYFYGAWQTSGYIGCYAEVL